MAKYNLNDIVPFEATHPGEILKDELEARGIKQKDFAQAIGIPSSNLNEILKGKRGINANLAMKLHKELGISYDFWMNLQASYEKDCVAIKNRDNANAEADNWLLKISEKFNLRELFKRLDIDEFFSFKQLKLLVERLGFNSPSDIVDAIPTFGNFKKSDNIETNERNLNTWLLLVHAKISKYDIKNQYSGNLDFVAKSLAAMANGRALSKDGIRDLFEENGIIYIEEPKIDKAPVDAYSTWRGKNPVIAVTYRYGDDADKLAFDLLHELGHIKYHNGQSFLNIKDYDRSNPLEKQADSFAEDCLIPPKVWKELMKVSVNHINPQEVVRKLEDKALELNINPSIASNRYLHLLSKYNVKRIKHSILH